MPYTPPPFAELTAPQKRQLIAAYAADSTPLRVSMHDANVYDLVLQGIAQDQRRGADPYTSHGTMVVAKFDATPHLLVLQLAAIASLEPLALNVTDPRHPDYVPEAQVITPIPVEAMASRKRRTPNQHDQL